MKSHLNRKRSIAYYAIPEEGTAAFDKRMKELKKFSEAHLENDKIIFERYKTAGTIIAAQMENGAGLALDQEIRSFIYTYNDRVINYGLHKMPSSFNVLESFCNYNAAYNFFELLEEENHLFSFFDFIDFITSAEFKENPQLIFDNLNEDLIYHYDILNRPNEITFTTEDGNEYVLGGVSLLRRGSEVFVFLITGLITDTDEETKKLIERDYKPFPGKEKLKLPDPKKQKAVTLFDHPNYWKTLAYCRIDIENMTIEARYIQKDLDVAFDTICDDIATFTNKSGEVRTDSYKNNVKAIVEFAPLFEVATKCLYLPYYFNYYEGEITDEDHPTNLATMSIKKHFLKNKLVIPKEYNIKNRTVWCLKRNNKLKSDVVYFGENEFKIERTGYWKKINQNSLGKDKNGKEIHGRTWVQQTVTYFEEDNQTLIVSSKENYRDNAGSHPGYIYIMRSAGHKDDMFK